MVVGGLGRLLELIVGLLEEILGLRRVAAHVPLVRLLRGGDLLEGLPGELLRRGEIGVPVRVDVAGRLCGVEGDGGEKKKEGEETDLGPAHGSVSYLISDARSLPPPTMKVNEMSGSA